MNFKPVAESKPEYFLEKPVGVALAGYEWTQVMGLLIHCLSNEELAADLFEDQDVYNEFVIVTKKLQKQVLGVQEKMLLEANGEAPKLNLEVASHKKIILM